MNYKFAQKLDMTNFLLIDLISHIQPVLSGFEYMIAFNKMFIVENFR